MVLWYQCDLVNDAGSRMTSWIEERGARVNARLRLVDELGWWKVEEVYLPGIPREALTEMQNLNRKSLSSIA
jgi:hypothetical protein